MSHGPSDPLTWKPLGTLGKHLYRIDGDTLYVRNHGETTLDSTILFNDLCKQLIAQNGYVLSVVDLTDAGPSSPEARRYQAKAAKEFTSSCNEMAVFGMNRLVGIFVQLSMRATALISSRDPNVTPVSDEAAALRWRDERRSVLRARFGRNHGT